MRARGILPINRVIYTSDSMVLPIVFCLHPPPLGVGARWLFLGCARATPSLTRRKGDLPYHSNLETTAEGFECKLKQLICTFYRMYSIYWCVHIFGRLFHAAIVVVLLRFFYMCLTCC